MPSIEKSFSSWRQHSPNWSVTELLMLSPQYIMVTCLTHGEDHGEMGGWVGGWFIGAKCLREGRDGICLTHREGVGGREGWCLWCELPLSVYQYPIIHLDEWLI